MRNYRIILVACILQCLFLLRSNAATIDWKGTTNSDWGTGSNWSSGSVPGSGDAVQIGVFSFTNQPTLNSGTTTTIASLTFGVTKNATLTVNSGYTLSVTGNITQNPSTSLLQGTGTLTTTLAGAGSITCASLNVGNSSTFLSVFTTNNLNVVSTISSLHVSGNVAVNSTTYGVVFLGFAYNNATFSLQGGTTIVDGIISTANTNSGLLPTTSATPTFSVDMPSGSALSPVLQLTNAAAINTSSVAGTIDFYNNTGGTGTSTVYYNGTGNQEVYTTSTTALNTSPVLYQNLVFAGSLTKKADAGTVSVSGNMTLSPSSTETVDFATNSPVVTVGGNFTSNSGTTLNQGGTGTLTVTGTSSNAGTLNQTGSGNITFSGALTNVAATGVISQTSTGVITASSGFTNAGAYTQNTGSTGGMAVTGSLNNSGTVTQTAGNITVSGALTNASLTSIISQTSSGTITASGGLTNSGIISQGASATGGMTITGTFNNIDSLKQTGGAITVNGQLTNSGKLILGTANLTISGDYNNSGTYSQSTGTTLFNGTAAETLTDGSSAGTNFNKVSFSGAGAKTLSSGVFSVSSTGILTMIGTNSSLACGGNLTLKSDTTGSATVAAVPRGAIISGNVNVQRFMSGGSLSRRGYRLMSSPVNQGSRIYSINYLINSAYLTGTNGPAGGLDKAGNPTLYLFRENMAPQYTTFLNSCYRGVNDISASPLYGMDDTTYPTANIPVGNGYLFFFRGDRNAASLATETTPGYVPVHATLTATGTLNVDTITVKEWYTPTKWGLGYSTTVGNDSVRGYNLVGNPYASTINWDTYQTVSNTTGIYGSSVKNKMYVLDEVTKTFGSYIAGSGGVGSQSFVSNMIASGQGFFVVATCSCARITFSESAKTNSLPLDNKLLMGTSLIAINNQYLRLQLMGKDSTIGEQTLIRFKDNASNTYDDDLDAYYKPGPGAASLFTRSQDNAGLCINTIPLPGTKSKIIKLNVNATDGGLYTLSLRDLVAVPQLYDVWLMDAYKKDSLDMRQNKTYSFNIDKSDTASFGNNRFTLVIRQNPAYAYQLLDFAANKITGNKRQVSVTWSAKNEGNYTAFTVERSIDSGLTYQVLGGVKATDQGSYSFLDINPIVGANLYRLKQEDINNAISYSKVITIQYSGLSGSELGNNINIYPNPVSNNISLNIPATSSNSETYDIKVISTAGLIVQEKTASGQLWQGNTTDLQPGTYILRVFNHDTQNLIGESKFVKL